MRKLRYPQPTQDFSQGGDLHARHQDKRVFVGSSVNGPQPSVSSTAAVVAGQDRYLFFSNGAAAPFSPMLCW